MGDPSVLQFDRGCIHKWPSLDDVAERSDFHSSSSRDFSPVEKYGVQPRNACSRFWKNESAEVIVQPLDQTPEVVTRQPFNDAEQSHGKESLHADRGCLYVEGKKVRTTGRLVRVAFLDGEGYDFLEDPERALETFRQSRRRVDLFTFIQRLSDTAQKYSYPLEWDNMAVLPISTFDHWMTSQIDFKARNKVRKAARNGVVVREAALDEAFVRGISAIYNESPIRQGRKFRHYGKDLESLRKMKSTFFDRSIFIGAFLKDELIGFIKMVTDEKRSQAGLMHIFSMMHHRDKAPTNALIAQAVRSCADRGISYLWYANFSYGNKQRDTLADFKRHNGFGKVQVCRYYVPLSTAGRVAFRLGFQHGLLHWVPEPVISKCRQIRSFWYKKRLSGSESA